MNHSIRLVLIDVDGTLYGPNGVPQCAWDAAHLATAKGLHLGVCTGRPGRGFALEYAKNLDQKGLHIFESGAVVVSGSGELVMSRALPTLSYQFLLELSRSYEVPFEVYTAEGGFYRETDHPDLLAHERMIGFEAEVIDLSEVPGEIIRAQFVPRPTPGWAATRAAVIERSDVDLHEATSPGIPGVGFNSVTAAGVSKRSAALWVANHYGYDLSHTAMIGDGENDLELIRAAGLGVAMGNAPDSVKASAEWVVARVEDCGLAEALNRISEGVEL